MNSTVPSLSENILTGLTLSVIALGTMIGNMLVTLAVALVRKLQTPSNFLIVSLAVSDLFVGLVVMPITIIYHLNQEWPFNEALCDTYIAFDVLLCTASILNLCAISVDRYLAITKPLRYAVKRTPKRMFLMIGGVWVASALISIPPMFGFKEKWVASKCGYSENVYYQIYATAGAFYIPLIVMIVLYGRIFVLARRMAKEDAKQKRISESVAASKPNQEEDLTQRGSFEQQSPTYQRNALLIPPPSPAVDRYDSKHENTALHNSLVLNGTTRKQFEGSGKRNSDTDERYPLPPSEACRRRKPRPLHKETYHRSALSVGHEPKGERSEEMSYANEFEERIKMLRKLRAEFFAAPPARHCSSLILSLRRTEEDKTEIVVANPAQNNEMVPTVAPVPNRSQHHTPLHQSQSMKEPSYAHKDCTARNLPRRSMCPPPLVSISHCPDEQQLLSSPSQGSDAFTTFTLLEADRELASRTPSISTTQTGPFQTQPIRPRPRPLHGVRRSLANTGEYATKDSQGRACSLGVPKYPTERRQSSPQTSGTSLWGALRPDSNQSIIGRSASRLFHLSSSEQPAGNQRSRSGSWSSARINARKKKSRSHSETKAIRTLGVIMGCFCLCWLPFFIIALANPLAKMMNYGKLTSETVNTVFLWLGYLNSTINPIIYAIFNREFRIPFKHLLMCRCRGINARLRSQRYAIEFGLGASTASCLPPQFPVGGAENNGIPVGSGGTNIRRSHSSIGVRRPTIDATSNHAQFGYKSNPHILQIPD
uniref:5-hydroxytryptamine receptor 1A-3 n=1 Tax=Cryptocotyle lingua TaxID=66766 RepID=A0A7U0TJ29_9TREM|nr:5-hydroxytryptamine receptor 1A-3 [Cryptocotyle lingua]